MKMNMSPLASLLQPDTRLFRSSRGRFAIRVNFLGDPDVTHDRTVAHEPNVRRGNRRLLWPAGWLHMEIEFVKSHSLDKMAACFRLKRTEGRVAKTCVRLPVLLVDRVEELLSQLNQIGF